MCECIVSTSAPLCTNASIVWNVFESNAHKQTDDIFFQFGFNVVLVWFGPNEWFQSVFDRFVVVFIVVAVSRYRASFLLHFFYIYSFRTGNLFLHTVWVCWNILGVFFFLFSFRLNCQFASIYINNTSEKFDYKEMNLHILSKTIWFTLNLHGFAIGGKRYIFW